MAGSNDTTMTFNSMLHGPSDDSTAADSFVLHGAFSEHSLNAGEQQNELQELWQMDPLARPHNQDVSSLLRHADTSHYDGLEDSALVADDSVFQEPSVLAPPVDNSVLYKDMSKMGELSLRISTSVGEEELESMIGEPRELTPLKPLMTDGLRLSPLESCMTNGQASLSLLKPVMTNCDQSFSPLKPLVTDGEGSLSPLKPPVTDGRGPSSPLKPLISDGPGYVSLLRPIMTDGLGSLSLLDTDGGGSLSPFKFLTTDDKESVMPLLEDEHSLLTPLVTRESPAMPTQKPKEVKPSKRDISPINRTNSSSTHYMTNMTYNEDSTIIPMSVGKVLIEGEDENQSDSTPVITSSSGSNAEVIKLKQELKAKEHDLQLAATIGKELLETNGKLQTDLDNTVKDMSGKIEELEQLNYSQNMKLEHRAKMEKNYLEEMESLKKALARQKAEHEEFIDSEHNKKVTELKKQLSSQQTELEQAQLQARQQLEQKQQLEQLLQEAREQLDQRLSSLNETSSEELSQLHYEVNSLQNEKISMLRELNEAHNTEEQLQHSLQRARVQLEAKDEEVEEKQCQSTAYYNALERVREENQELRVELDLARMESQNMKKKGNSLFSEVEDRRVTAEKEVISLRVKFDALTKQHKITRQHEHTLKLQLSVLLHKAGGTADMEHMQRLQQQLAQARSEIRTFDQKLVAAEKQPVKKDPKNEIFEAWCKERDPNSMMFFEKVLENKNKELEDVQREMKTKRIQMLAENQKVLQYESKLYATEKQLEKQKDATLQLKLKIDELRLKYEPDAVTKGREIKRIVEKIPIPSAKPDDKENKPLKETWLPGKDKLQNDSAKTQPGAQPTSLSSKPPLDESLAAKLRELRSTQPISARALPKSAVPEKCTLEKTVLKSLQKKSVRLSDDVDVIEVECNVSDKCEAEGAEKAPEVKGRVRGRQRYNKVNMIKNDGEEETNCAQQ